jgi:hypothetical protein
MKQKNSLELLEHKLEIFTQIKLSLIYRRLSKMEIMDKKYLNKATQKHQTLFMKMSHL